MKPSLGVNSMTNIKQGSDSHNTKSGYGTMVVLGIEQYAALTDEVEMKLDEADRVAKATSVRYTADEVFGRVRVRLADK